MAYCYGQLPGTLRLSNTDLSILMNDHISMSISVDSPFDETLNRGPLALHLRRQYEFPFGIDIVQFSFFSGVQSMDLKFPRSKVPAEDTMYACYVFDVPQDQEYHLIGFEALIDNKNVMHHMVAFTCDETGITYLTLSIRVERVSVIKQIPSMQRRK